MISSPGIGSNLDVNNIVAQLMAVESLPLSALDQKEGRLQAKLSTLGQIKSAFAAFETATESLGSASEKDAYSSTVGDATVLSASASSTASEGQHSITVTQIAAAQRLVAAGQSDPAAAIGTGATTTVTIHFGAISGGSFDDASGTYSGAAFTEDTNRPALTLTFDATNNTLEGIRDAINALDSDVTASIVNDGSGTPYRLSISSNTTGVDNSLKIDVSGDAALTSLLGYDPAATQNLKQTQAAANAEFIVDGIPVTSASNSAADVLTGVTFNLKAAGTTTLGIARDTSKIRSALETLAGSYNELNSLIAKSTGLEAILQGDRAPVYLQNRIRSALGASQGGISDNFSTLSQLGLSFQRDGSLKFDNTRLQAALGTAPAEVRALIGAFGESLGGLAEQLSGSNGPLNARTEGLNRSIADISDRREVLNRRLEATEIRLRNQFAALDTLISGMLATSTYLEQQLANLPKITGQQK